MIIIIRHHYHHLLLQGKYGFGGRGNAPLRKRINANCNKIFAQASFPRLILRFASKLKGAALLLVPARMPDLKHGVGQEGLQGPLLTVGLCLIVLEQLIEIPVLFAVGQNLQAVLVVPDKLLVDVEHRQQDVKQVGCKQRKAAGDRANPDSEPRGRFSLGLWV